MRFLTKKGLYDSGRVLFLPVEDIAPNPGQPRTQFSQPELEELAALMKQQAEKRFAPMVQTAPAPENETDNRAFCI